MKPWLIVLFVILSMVVFAYVYADEQKMEGMVDRGTPDTNHTVNIPLTTRAPSLCSPQDGGLLGNFCGPSAKCAMTGANCLSDVDCVGCMPKDVTTTPMLHAYEDSGKASWGMTYSDLTDPWSRDSLSIGPLPALLPPMPYLEEDAFKGKFQTPLFG
jgi:hypothetical protein